MNNGTNSKVRDFCCILILILFSFQLFPPFSYAIDLHGNSHVSDTVCSNSKNSDIDGKSGNIKDKGLRGNNLNGENPGSKEKSFSSDSHHCRQKLLVLRYDGKTEIEDCLIFNVENNIINLSKKHEIRNILPDCRYQRYIESGRKLIFLRFNLINKGREVKYLLVTKDINTGVETEYEIFTGYNHFFEKVGNEEIRVVSFPHIFLCVTPGRYLVIRNLQSGIRYLPLVMYPSFTHKALDVITKGESYINIGDDAGNISLSNDGKKILFWSVSLSGPSYIAIDELDNCFDPTFDPERYNKTDYLKIAERLKEHNDPHSKYLWSRLNEKIRGELNGFEENKSEKAASSKVVRNAFKYFMEEKTEIGGLKKTKIFSQRFIDYVEHYSDMLIEENIRNRAINYLLLKEIFPDELKDKRMGSPVVLARFKLKGSFFSKFPHKCWSPDDRKILFVSPLRESGDIKICIINLDQHKGYLLEENDIISWKDIFLNLKVHYCLSRSLTRIWNFLDMDTRNKINATEYLKKEPDEESKKALLAALNKILARRDFYNDEVFYYAKVDSQISSLLNKGINKLSDEEIILLNYRIINAVFQPFMLEKTGYEKTEIVHISGDPLKVNNPDLEWTGKGMVITCPDAIYVKDAVVGGKKVEETRKLEIPEEITCFRNGKISPDGSLLMFFGKIRDKESINIDYLFILNLETGKIAKTRVGFDRLMDDYQGAWILDEGISVIKNEYDDSVLNTIIHDK